MGRMVKGVSGPNREPGIKSHTLLHHRRRIASLKLSSEERRVRQAYKQPDEFETFQTDNGHLDAEERILRLFMKLNYVGTTVVSLACGSGWLDRILVHRREQELIQGKTKLRLLGVDDSPESIASARRKMEDLLEKNQDLRKCYEDDRFRFDYRLTRLGGPSAARDENGKEIRIPDFSELDLRDTVIGDQYADTFIIFMALTLWVSERDAAIRSIAEKCRGPGESTLPSFVLNGEEFPTHVTPNPSMPKEFKRAVRERLCDQVDPHIIWETLFRKYGLVELNRSSTQLGLAGDDHTMYYAFFKYQGKE